MTEKISSPFNLMVTEAVGQLIQRLVEISDTRTMPYKAEDAIAVHIMFKDGAYERQVTYIAEAGRNLPPTWKRSK